MEEDSIRRLVEELWRCRSRLRALPADVRVSCLGYSIVEFVLFGASDKSAQFHPGRTQTEQGQQGCAWDGNTFGGNLQVGDVD